LELEQINCDLCGNGKHQPVATISGEAGSAFNLVKCSKCGLVFVNPRPTPASLAGFYSQWFDDVSPERRNEDFLAMEHVYDDAYAYISKYFSGGPILDVGCGYGCFMEYMAGRGFEVFGTDYSAPLLQYLQDTLKYSVFQGDLEEIPYPDNKFHVISLFYVLEHVTSPAKILEKCFNLLTKEGIIYIRIPNYNLGRAVIFLRKTGIKISPRLVSIICVPNHLFYFTPATISQMLTSAGFHNVTVKSATPTQRGKWILRAGRNVFFRMEKAVQSVFGNTFIVNPALTITGRK